MEKGIENKMQHTKGRVEYIDIAKGIGILLVIVGHIVWKNDYPFPGSTLIRNFIYSFHMPLFFVISGLCIKDTKRLDRNTIKKMAKTYLIPYAIWTVLYLLCFQMQAMAMKYPSIFNLNDYRIVRSISDFGLAPLWFILALFISDTIVLTIKTFLKKPWCILTLCVFFTASIMCSIWTMSIDNISFLAYNWLMGTLRIFPATFYVMFGYLIKEPLKKIEALGMKRWIIVVSLAGIQTILCLRWNEIIDIHVFDLGNPWLYFIKGLIGSIAIILLSQLFHSNVVIMLGRKSKELMILHYPPFYYTLILGALLDEVFEPNILGLIIIATITIVSCLMIDWLCSKTSVWNFMMGKTISHKTDSKT